MFETALGALGLYAGLNILWSLSLGMRAAMLRGRSRIYLGNGNEIMQRAIRAHGNNIEYVPLALVGMSVLYILGAHVLFIHAVGAVFTLGRIMHGVALSKTNRSRPQEIGMVLTFASLIFITGGCLYWALI